MQDAPLYASSNQLQRRDAALALDSVIPDMNWDEEGERIMDIGCGTGDVTSSLLLSSIPVKVSLLQGTDSSLEMVSYAKIHHSGGNLSYTVMDIEKATQVRRMFPEGFNKIFSLYCLHWVRDLASTLSNIKELLVEGGEAMVIFLASNPIFKMYRIMATKPKWAKYMKVKLELIISNPPTNHETIKDVETFIPVYQSTTSPDTVFRDTMVKSGLQVKRCESKEVSFTFSNDNQAVAAVRAVNPFLGRIPADLRTEFIAECVATLLLITNSEPGKIEARYFSLFKTLWPLTLIFLMMIAFPRHSKHGRIQEM